MLAGSLLWTAAGLAAPPGNLPFGVYDPYGAFSDDTDVSIEHLFLPWQDVFLPSLLEADAYASERGRAVLVTIEPWTWTRDERNRPEVLIAGIQNGDFDGNMATNLQHPRRLPERGHRALGPRDGGPLGSVHLGRLDARDLHRRLPAHGRCLPRRGAGDRFHVVAAGAR